MARADAGECDLIAKTVKHRHERGFLYRGQGKFQPDCAKRTIVSENVLRNLVQREHLPITYTCATPGSGVRLALDRNQNGVYDGDERGLDAPDEM